MGDFSEGLLGGASSFTVGPNEGESVGSMSVGSSVVGSVVEGCNEVSKHDICV